MFLKKYLLIFVIILNLIIMTALTYNAHGFSIFENAEPSINIQANRIKDANMIIEGDAPPPVKDKNNNKPPNTNQESSSNNEHHLTDTKTSNNNIRTKSSKNAKQNIKHGKKINAVIKNFEIDSNIYNNKIYSNSHVNITLEWDTDELINNEDYVEFILPNKNNDIFYFSDNKTWNVLNKDKDIVIGKAMLNKDKFTVIFNKNIEKIDNVNKTIKFNTMIIFNENIYQKDNLKVTIKTDSNHFTKDFILSKDINSYIKPVKSHTQASLSNKSNLKINIISDDNKLSFKDYEFSIYQSKEPSKLIDKKTSNNYGEVNFDDLNSGTYYIKMTKAPYGYELDNKVKSMYLDEFKASVLEVPAIKLHDNYDTQAELTINQNFYSDELLYDISSEKYNPITNDNFINPTIISILISLTIVLFGLIKLRKKFIRKKS